jgi:hypothetical protein
MKTSIALTKSLVIFSLLLANGFSGARTVAALDIGQKAPAFNLPSTTGEMISLSRFKGKKNVLIQFYTMDFNPT